MCNENNYINNRDFNTNLNRNLFSPAQGLANGSLFPNLVIPYFPDQSLDEMNYLRNYNERGCQK